MTLEDLVDERAETLKLIIAAGKSEEIAAVVTALVEETTKARETADYYAKCNVALRIEVRALRDERAQWIRSSRQEGET